MFIKEQYRIIDLGDAVVSENVEYDSIFHVPVATDKFIRKYTGTSVAEEYSAPGFKAVDYHRRLYYALILQSLINYKTPRDHDRIINEYLLAHDVEKQNKFAYLTALIADADDTNSFGDLAVEHGLEIGVPQDVILTALEIPMIKMNLEQWHLVDKNWKITIAESNYRRGY